MFPKYNDITLITVRSSSQPDAEQFFEMIRDVLRAASFNVVARDGRRDDERVPVDLADVREFLGRTSIFQLYSQNEVATIHWNLPDDPIRALLPDDWLRVQLKLVGNDRAAFERGVELLEFSAGRLGANWGEVVRPKLEGKVTGGTGSVHFLPRLASANYFCEAYVDWLGGEDALRSVGFESVRRSNQGFIVELPTFRDLSEFDAARLKIESKLGPEGAFSRGTVGFPTKEKVMVPVL